jgi:hypothetical protein
MVAVTIILGLVTAGFVLDLGNKVESETPQAAFDYSLNTTTGELTVTHQSGADIDGDKLRFGGAALEKERLGSITEWSGETVSAGDSAVVTVQADETLRLVWENVETEESAVISEYDVPLFAGTDARITGTSSGSGGPGNYPTHVRVEIDNFATPTGELYVKIENCDSGDVVTRTYQDPPGTERIDLGRVNNGDLIRMTTYWSDSEANQVNIDWAEDTGSAWTDYDDDPDNPAC